MNAKNKTLIKYISEWTLAAMTVIVGVLFIWQTLSIYFTGHSPEYSGEYVYTAENVGKALSLVAPYFWLWVAMAVAVYVISQIFPTKVKLLKPDVRYTLKRMKKKLGDKTEYDGNEKYAFIKKEELTINILWSLCGIFCLIGTIMAIVYLANPAYFPKTNVNREMFNMVVNIFPYAIAAFVFACGITFYQGISSKRQISAVKELTSGRKSQKKHSWTMILSDKRVVWGIRGAILAIAVAFIICGTFNEGMRDVLIKAVNICTECIGLG